VLAVAALAALLLSMGSRPASACPLITQGSQARAAAVVFTGTVSEVPRAGSAGPTRFEVDTVYKGPAATTYVVRIPDAAAGGVDLALNERWTVFAIRSGGGLIANACTGLVRGDVDPSAHGLPPGTSGIHRPLSLWLAVFTVAAVVALIVGLALVARRRRLQAK
jgi:hypothetical protein